MELIVGDKVWSAAKTRVAKAIGESVDVAGRALDPRLIGATHSRPSKAPPVELAESPQSD